MMHYPMNESSVTSSSRLEGSSEKKQYQSPRLTVWGTVRDLTEGAPTGSLPDFPSGSRPLE